MTWLGATIVNPVITVAHISNISAANQSFRSIQYMGNSPALPPPNDVSALRPNIFTASIVTAIQAPAWTPSNDLNQPALAVFKDFAALLDNQWTLNAVTALQAVVWLPAVSSAQPALFAGSDMGALRANQNMNASVTALQNPAWIPAVTTSNPAQFAGSDIGALYPNLWTLGAPPYLQSPAWLPAVPTANPAQAAFLDIAALLANQQTYITDNTPVVVQENLRMQRWWRRWALLFIINITDALGAITDSLSAVKIPASTILYIYNKLTMFVDQW